LLLVAIARGPTPTAFVLAAPPFTGFSFSFGRTSHRAGGVPKDFTALGGKVGSPTPGIEAEEGEGVEVGSDAAKLLTLGVGEVDKDPVLQPGQAQIDRLQPPSQQIVLKLLHVLGSLRRRRIQPSGLGLMEKIIDELNELAARLGNFCNHG
jgi:hypothetical protein